MPALFLSSRKRTPEMMKSHWPLNLVFLLLLYLLFCSLSQWLNFYQSQCLFFFFIFFQRHVRLHLKTLFEFYACA